MKRPPVGASWRLVRFLASLLMGTLLLTGIPHLPVARAADDAEAEGLRRFKRGQKLYVQGHFLDAAKEFEAGYAVAARPQFQLNIGHCYRRAGEFARAREAYLLYLKLDPTSSRRAEVEGHLKAIDDALPSAESPVVKPEPAIPPPPVVEAPPPPPSPPEAVPSQPRQPAPLRSAGQPRDEGLVAGAPTAPSSAPASEEGQSVLRKPWFWVAVGVVVAGGAAGAYFGLRATSSSGCSTATVCIVEGH